MKMKEKKLGFAEKERKSLEKKLDYVNKSIESIKHYDFSAGRGSAVSPQSHTVISDPLEIVRKNKEFHERVKEDKRKIEEKKHAEKKRQ